MTIATSVHTRLQKSDHVAEGTMAFHFVKPAGFDYQAGQSIDLTLLNPPETDAEGNTRTFTLASAPFDSDLMITTRMRDTAFKRVMGKASPGLEVKLEGPSGSFVLHRKVERPAVFLAGGIGITPFLSIVRQAVHNKTAHQLYLFYSNRRPEDTAFMEVLAEGRKKESEFSSDSHNDPYRGLASRMERRNWLYRQKHADEIFTDNSGANLLPCRTAGHGCSNEGHAG